MHLDAPAASKIINYGREFVRWPGSGHTLTGTARIYNTPRRGSASRQALATQRRVAMHQSPPLLSTVRALGA